MFTIVSLPENVQQIVRDRYTAAKNVVAVAGDLEFGFRTPLLSCIIKGRREKQKKTSNGNEVKTSPAKKQPSRVGSNR